MIEERTFYTKWADGTTKLIGDDGIIFIGLDGEVKYLVPAGEMYYDGCEFHFIRTLTQEEFDKEYSLTPKPIRR